MITPLSAPTFLYGNMIDIKVKAMMGYSSISTSPATFFPKKRASPGYNMKKRLLL
jgi:hypothetical protein